MNVNHYLNRNDWDIFFLIMAWLLLTQVELLDHRDSIVKEEIWTRLLKWFRVSLYTLPETWYPNILNPPPVIFPIIRNESETPISKSSLNLVLKYNPKTLSVSFTRKSVNVFRTSLLKNQVSLTSTEFSYRFNGHVINWVFITEWESPFCLISSFLFRLQHKENF